MQTIADLHIHSKYARACSKQLELKNIDIWAAKKGVNVIATGDWTHPAWFKSIKSELKEVDNTGLYRYKGSNTGTLFFLSTEIACIYSKWDKCRRLHINIFAPNIETVEKINAKLDKVGKLGSDGRPIIGYDAKKLAELVFSVNPDCMVVPSHAWTPWFAIFGSKSGFDSIEECFEEYSDRIYAIETGLSSDPPMNWRLSALDNITLISNSDAHSLKNIGREANIFDLKEVSYNSICKAIKSGSKKTFKRTIEFYPEEGMYHFDGHRNCKVSFSPSETKKLKGICPVCKKPLTLGVDYRIDQLADRPEKKYPPMFDTKDRIGYVKLVELDKIIADYFGIKSRTAKTVLAEYEKIIANAGNEMNVLLNVDYDELKMFTNEKLVEGIRRVREGNLKITPGYDGTYGKIEIFKEAETVKGRKARQKSLF